MRVRCYRRIIGATLALSVGACGPSPSEGPDAPASQYEIPLETGDGWSTTSAESVGMAIEPLDGLVSRIAGAGQHRIHGILVARDGHLVFERYWPGYDLERGTRDPVYRQFHRETLHYAASVSKSITSILAGIAIEEGAIEGWTPSSSPSSPNTPTWRWTGNRRCSMRSVAICPTCPPTPVQRRP